PCPLPDALPLGRRGGARAAPPASAAVRNRGGRAGCSRSSRPGAWVSMRGTTADGGVSPPPDPARRPTAPRRDRPVPLCRRQRPLAPGQGGCAGRATPWARARLLPAPVAHLGHVLAVLADVAPVLDQS